MTGTSTLLMWGERGLIATFFADLCQIDSEDVFNEFLSIVDYPKPIEAQAAIPKSVEYIIEPDFANTGFGHPDAVIAAEYETAPRAVFIVEAKRVAYAKACKPSSKRGTRGFNSTLNGQLELDYCLALALARFKEGDPGLVEPEWTPRSPYSSDRKGKQRSLKKRAVLDAVVSKLNGAPPERYYYIVITNEEENPLDTVEEKYLPQLYKPDRSGPALSFRNCWPQMRRQFGWLNYHKMRKFVKSREPDMHLGSLFLQSFEMNRDNMIVQVISRTAVRAGRGVRMIYAPKINAQTFLHFSWRDQSCALRDYSRSDTGEPVPDRRCTTSEVEQRIEEEIVIPRRPDIGQVAFWYEKTLRLNAECSDKYPELLQK